MNLFNNLSSVIYDLSVTDLKMYDLDLIHIIIYFFLFIFFFFFVS